MATSSKRDVKLAVGIETTGGASVRTLADEVRRLGAEGAPAAAEFQALADQIDRLGDQVGLPRGDVGDLVAIFQAGAYGASASPSTFLGQGPAREMLV